MAKGQKQTAKNQQPKTNNQTHRKRLRQALPDISEIKCVL